MWGGGGAPRAPRERQTAAAGVYSGAMKLPLPYRPAASAVLNPANGGANGFGAAVIRQGDFRLTSGKNFKMRNFGGVLSNFAPVPSSPFAPGGSLSFPFIRFYQGT